MKGLAFRPLPVSGLLGIGVSVIAILASCRPSHVSERIATSRSDAAVIDSVRRVWDDVDAAWDAGDTVKMGRVFAPDFRAATASGRVLGRAEVLRYIANIGPDTGATAGQSHERDESARLFGTHGDVAVCTAEATDVIRTSSGIDTDITRVTDVFERRASGWQLLFSHESFMRPPRELPRNWRPAAHSATSSPAASSARPRAVIALTSSPRVAASQSYLFVWAGGPGGSEFIATIDASPASATYGRVLASVPTGTTGFPHHTEHQLGPGGHLLANDFHAGRTWLFDLHEPLHPHILTSFGDVAGYSHPHTFIRLANGRVLSTFQYRAAPSAGAQPQAPAGSHAEASAGSTAHMAPMQAHVTGGLVEMDERGHPFLAGSAADTTIPDRLIYPYSVLPIPAANRAISTTTDMDHSDTVATSEWIQLWRLSDLTLLRSFALPPGPRGDENRLTGEPRLLADGRSIYIHTFSCGLYLLRGVESDTATLVHAFEGAGCGVPILTGHYWIQTVPAMHGVVALDVADPEHPREVSRLDLGPDENPHWVAIDRAGRRIVLNSAGKGSRLFLIDFDPASGRLAVDERFRDPGSDHAGISLAGSNWPRGYNGSVVPHGAVFSTP